MEIEYQILPYKTKKERSKMISNVLTSAAYPRNPAFQDDILKKNKGKLTVNHNNTLINEFRDFFQDFFQDYIDFVEFYKTPLLIESGECLDKDIKIEDLNLSQYNPLAKGKMGGADIFIAINLDKVEAAFVEKRLALAKSLLHGDTSLLNELPLELIKNISQYIRPTLEFTNTHSGGAKYNKKHKKRINKSKKKKKDKINKSKRHKNKINKSKKRKRRSKKTKKR